MSFKRSNPELEDLLDDIVFDLPTEKRKMFGCQVHFLHDKLMCGVFGDNIFVRLSGVDQEKPRIENDEVQQFEPLKGKKMREYITLPEMDIQTLTRIIAESADYVMGID